MAIVLSAALASLVSGKLDDAQCTEAFHKSAVTPEAAAEAAAKAKQAKAEFGGEIYSSKVKSKSRFPLRLDSIRDSN